MTFEEADKLVKFIVRTIKANNKELAELPQWEEKYRPVIEHIIGSTLAVLEHLQDHQKEDADKFVELVVREMKTNDNKELAEHPQWEEQLRPAIEYIICITLEVLELLQDHQKEDAS